MENQDSSPLNLAKGVVAHAAALVFSALEIYKPSANSYNKPRPSLHSNPMIIVRLNLIAAFCFDTFSTQ